MWWFALAYAGFLLLAVAFKFTMDQAQELDKKEEGKKPSVYGCFAAFFGVLQLLVQVCSKIALTGFAVLLLRAWGWL